MSTLRKALPPAIFLIAMPAFAAVRLTYQLYGTAVPVAWPDGAFPLRYSVDRKVNDAFPAGLGDRRFNAWTAISDARPSFTSAGVGDVQARNKGPKAHLLAAQLFHSP